MGEALTTALARAASRFVGESKVGTRKGSVRAIAAAMTDRGVEVSASTLGRRLDGEYPFNSDEIAALAAVLGVDPDAIWRDALRIMQETPPPARPAPDELEDGLSAEGRRVVDEGRAKRAKDAPPPAGEDEPPAATA